MELNFIYYLRLANEIARKSRASGNTPFGAVLVDEKGKVLLEQGNAEHDKHDATAHAERVIASRASQTFSKEKLWKCTLVTTVEPCPMCTGAVYWANIGTIVYGITEKTLLSLTGNSTKNPTFSMGAKNIIQKGQKKINIFGPFPEIMDEIVNVQKGFWD